jgi:hypothetical protein
MRFIFVECVGVLGCWGVGVLGCWGVGVLGLILIKEILIFSLNNISI